jgi:hypothetical protein
MKVLRALTLAENDPDAALHSLLSAWEQREMADPQSLAFSILIVAQSLMINGNPAAALRLLEAIQANDEVVQRVRMQAATQEQRENIFIRLARVCDAAPDDHPLKEQLDAIDQAVYQLEWLKADQLLQEVAPKNPTDPHLLRRIGSLLLLRNQDDAAAAWQHLAASAQEEENERLFAEIVSILRMPTDDAWMTDVLNVTYPVDALDPVLEKLASNKQFYLSPQPPEPRDDSPPPRAQYFVLDRPLPTELDSLTIDDVPYLVGELTLYGKQTDAPARLVLETIASDLDAANKALALVADNLLESGREVIGGAFTPEVETSLNLFMPPEISPEDRERISKEAQRISILEKWPTVKHPALAGMSPEEAMADSAKRQAVNALVVLLETSSAGLQLADFHALRKRLGLPHETVAAESVSTDKMLNYDELTRLPLEELSDDQLINVSSQLSMFGPRLLGAAIEVAMKRPSLMTHERYRIHTLCEIVAKQSPDRLEAVKWLLRAADAADASGDSAAEYLMALLVPAAMTRQEEILNGALTRLTSKHIDEPGVREGLMSFFQMIGIDPATGQPMGQPSAVGAPSAAASEPESGLWTPDGGGGGQEDKGGGGLWLPD